MCELLCINEGGWGAREGMGQRKIHILDQGGQARLVHFLLILEFSKVNQDLLRSRGFSGLLSRVKAVGSGIVA